MNAFKVSCTAYWLNGINLLKRSFNACFGMVLLILSCAQNAFRCMLDLVIEMT